MDVYRLSFVTRSEESEAPVDSDCRPFIARRRWYSINACPRVLPNVSSRASQSCLLSVRVGACVRVRVGVFVYTQCIWLVHIEDADERAEPTTSIARSMTDRLLWNSRSPRVHTTATGVRRRFVDHRQQHSPHTENPERGRGVPHFHR